MHTKLDAFGACVYLLYGLDVHRGLLMLFKIVFNQLYGKRSADRSDICLVEPADGLFVSVCVCAGPKRATEMGKNGIVPPELHVESITFGRIYIPKKRAEVSRLTRHFYIESVVHR